MGNTPEENQIAYENLGEAFIMTMRRRRHLFDDATAKAFDIVCAELTKDISKAGRLWIDSMLDLDLANPWRCPFVDDPEGARRPVELRNSKEPLPQNTP